MGRGRRVIRQLSRADESAIRRKTTQEDIVTEEDLLYDEISQHHNLKEKILLERSGCTEYSSEDEPLIEGDVEEVMPLLCSDSDTEEEEDEDNETEDENRNETEDVQSSTSEQDEEQVPSQAWGHSKAVYYNTDYVDDEAGGSSDEELAEEEEREALDMQQRLAGSLEERDFGIEPLMEFTASEKASAVVKSPVNLAELNDQDKIKLLCLESPEFMDLYSDCKTKLKEEVDTLSPLVVSARNSTLPTTTQGLSYLNTKSMLFKMYCLNVMYYLYLKAKRLSVIEHPVVTRIVQLRELIGNLSAVDDILKSDLSDAVALLKVVPDISHGSRDAPASTTTTNKLSSPRKDTTSRKRRSKQVTFDDPLAYYEEVKSAKKRKKAEHQKSNDMKDNVPELLTVEADGKRAITYQIARNQGLMPKRKKEQRNPRVRHRKKFDKALTKYKSMARPVQYEMQRYGGEKTGIKANLARSVKIK